MRTGSRSSPTSRSSRSRWSIRSQDTETTCDEAIPLPQTPPSPACGAGMGRGPVVMRRELLIPLTSERATDPDVVGPKAANLARLGRAGLPTPGGFCLSAAAYRVQLVELGLETAARRVASAEPFEARRIAVELRLELYQRPIVPSILEPLLHGL